MRTYTFLTDLAKFIARNHSTFGCTQHAATADYIYSIIANAYAAADCCCTGICWQATIKDCNRPVYIYVCWLEDGGFGCRVASTAEDACEG